MHILIYFRLTCGRYYCNYNAYENLLIKLKLLFVYVYRLKRPYLTFNEDLMTIILIIMKITAALFRVNFSKSYRVFM